MRNPVPSFPVAPQVYDPQNEAAFRQSLERALQTLSSSFAAPDVVGTPDTLAAGNNNDFETGSRTILRLTPDASGSTLTGFAGGRDGKSLEIINVGSADLTLANQNASSSAENRLLLASGADAVLRQNQTATAKYDATTARWRVVQGDTSVVGEKSATLPSGSTNDYDAGSNTRLLRITANGAGSTLTGIAGGLQARQITIVCLLNTLTLAHASGSSTAANRFISATGADVVLAPDDNATLLYDSTSGRWRIIAVCT